MGVCIRYFPVLTVSERHTGMVKKNGHGEKGENYRKLKLVLSLFPCNVSIPPSSFSPSLNLLLLVFLLNLRLN